ADGRVRCWGLGNQGALGYTNDKTLPSPGGYVDVGGSVSRITAGANHTCALLATGKLRCWGQSHLTGYESTPLVPPSANGDVPVGGDVKQVDAGVGHTCAVLSTGRVRCWGNGYNGQLGYPGVQIVQVAGSAGDVSIAYAPTQSLAADWLDR
ncbi:MAG TPA: hypothetical protein VK524_02830, partial [Polyangiaceae bacterium]|nr:hypothetical protein [Polyangiaceae bacterium]